ncbi:putative Multidrug resistance protein A [Burkholderiales bacterium GJ-E10]|nr:putative Multidrug resistance protein A [Burkholderiales bacterium GJ-E10]
MNTTPKIKTRYRRLRPVAVLAVAAALMAYAYWDLFLSTTIRSDDAYVSGNIIPVQALVPGVVWKVEADNSMMVRAGQPLVEQDPNLLRARMEDGAAALAEAVRRIRSEIAQAAQSNHQLAALRLQRRKIADDLQRYVLAEAGGAVSHQKVADTRADLAILDRRIAAAQGNYAKAQALVANTDTRNNPLVLQKRADFIERYIELRRSRVVAPVDGFVANRRAEAGQRVAAGQLLMNVVSLEDLWVTANIKETEMAAIRPGQPVRITTHRYGATAAYHGKVLGIEPAGGSTFSLFPPDNATGNYIHIVERVPVRISLDAKDLASNPLRPGMSVHVDIDTAHAGASAPDSALASEVTAASNSYATRIYQTEMAAADAAADRIIRSN